MIKKIVCYFKEEYESSNGVGNRLDRVNSEKLIAYLHAKIASDELLNKDNIYFQFSCMVDSYNKYLLGDDSVIDFLTV